MRVKIKSHTTLEDKMLVSGFKGDAKEEFNDLEIKIFELFEFIQEKFPNYLLKFSVPEANDIEDSIFGTDKLFDEERLLDEIDYGIVSKYITESKLIA